jgi:ribosomal protein S27E
MTTRKDIYNFRAKWHSMFSGLQQDGLKISIADLGEMHDFCESLSSKEKKENVYNDILILDSLNLLFHEDADPSMEDSEEFVEMAKKRFGDEAISVFADMNKHEIQKFFAAKNCWKDDNMWIQCPGCQKNIFDNTESKVIICHSCGSEFVK